VFFDNVFVHDDYRVGELNKASSTSPSARHRTLLDVTFSPIRNRHAAARRYVKTGQIPRTAKKPLKDDPVIRQKVAQLATECEVAPRARRAVRRRRAEQRQDADQRGLELHSCMPPSCRAAWPTPPWTSPGPVRNSRCIPRMRR